MGVTVNRQALADALRPIVKVAAGDADIPILANVQLEWTAGDELLVTATDLDMAASAYVAASCPDIGALPINVNAFDLLASLDHLRGEQALIELTEAGGPVTVTGDGGGVRTLVQQAGEFPHLSGHEGDFWKVDAAVLRDVIRAVRPAISTEETRYYLNGVNCKTVDGVVRLAATDGHRLHVADLPLPFDGAFIADTIIPKAAIKHLLRMLDGHEGEVLYAIGRRRTAFAVGKQRLCTKTIDGTFPAYERVIPADPAAASVTASAREWLRVAEACSSVGGRDDYMLRLQIAKGIATVSLTVRDTSTEARELVEGTSVGEMLVGFNARYLVASAGLFAPDDLVTISFTQPVAPSKITSAARPDRLGVLMPMKV